MRKKTNILYSIILIISTVFTTCILAYAFYLFTNSKGNTNKVKSDDYLSIDSIKSSSVNDTIRYYNSKIRQYQVDEINKDSIINALTIEKKNLKKNYDSVSSKSDYFRQRLREIKLTTDTVQ